MKRRFFGLCAAALAISFTACNNDGEKTSTTNDSGNNSATNQTSSSSEGSYAAMADSVERNSEQGYYLNPQTGQPYGKLKVDRSTGRVTTEAGEPVWRYVDNRNWWVYGDDNWEDAMISWNQLGEAKKEGDKIVYKGDGDKWVDYDTKWKKDDDEIKLKSGDTKIKIEKDGDVKIKDGDSKTKIDDDGVKKKDN